jgi:hypothetical protein
MDKRDKIDDYDAGGEDLANHVDAYIAATASLDAAPVPGDEDPLWPLLLPDVPRVTGWSSAYYELPEGATELADLIDYKEMNFNVGNVFKAAYRLGNKHGTTAQYDLEKIIWYASRELKRVSGE